MPERYEFVRKIAQGGFGQVYLARDTRLGREVAIKRLLSPEESASYEQARATFEREATTLAAMQHPNIVQIYDFDRDAEGTFVVMEMLEGETLKDRLNRGPLTWNTFVSVTRQALDAINAAHSKGILHRDLKPENLFLHSTKSGTRVLKILDFGLAKLSSAPSRQTMDQSGNVFGSIYYMAPEQFMRAPLDGRTDLYALGCVFYQALTARFPFFGENMQANMEAHMEHKVRPIRDRRPDLSVPIGDWLMRLISFRPADRQPDAMTALREFDAALEGRVLQPAVKPPATATDDSAPASGTKPQPARMLGRPATKSGNPPSGLGRERPSGSAPSTSGVMKTPMQTRPSSAVEASRAEARARVEAAEKRKRLFVWIAAPSAIIAFIVVLLVLRPKPEKTEPAIPPHLTKGTSSTVASTTTTTDAPKAPVTPTSTATSVPKAPVNPTPTATAPPKAGGVAAEGAKAPNAPAPKAPAGAKSGGAPAANPAAAAKAKAKAALPLPETLPLALPMEASLVWRFRAGVETRHREADGSFGEAKLKRGQTVQFWRNLVSAETFSGLTLYEGKAERAPVAQGAEVRGAGTGHTFVQFPVGAGLQMVLKPEEAGRAPGAAGSSGACVVAVFRANGASKEAAMRPLLLSGADSKHSLSLHCRHGAGEYWAFAERDGQVAQSLVTPAMFSAREEGAGASWVVAMAVWNAENGTVSVRVCSPDGKIAEGPATAVGQGIAPLNTVNLGFVKVPETSKRDAKERFDGGIIEVAVYHHALDAATQDKVLKALWERYFNKP